MLDAAFDPAGVTVSWRDAAERVGQVRAAGGRSTRPAASVSSRASSACAGTSPASPTSRCSLTTAACRARMAAAAGDIRIVARNDLGWFWMIPISDALTSVGLRAAARRLRRAAADADGRPPRPRHRGDAGRRPARCGRRAGSGRCASRRTSRSGLAPTPATAGCSPATPDRSSTRCSRRAWPSPSSRESKPPAPSTALSPPATCRHGRSPPSTAASVSALRLPPLRPRLLSARVSRPLLPAHGRRLPRRGHLARRILAPLARRPPLAGGVLPADPVQERVPLAVPRLPGVGTGRLDEPPGARRLRAVSLRALTAVRARASMATAGRNRPSGPASSSSSPTTSATPTSAATGARARRPPCLDRLAAEGIRFTDGYANSPVCSPTRFALMTGRYQSGCAGPPRSRSRARARAPRPRLPPGRPTLPSLLLRPATRPRSPASGTSGTCLTSSPLRSGYQESFGPYGGGRDYFTHRDRAGSHDLFEGEAEVERAGYLTDLISDRAVEFVRRRAAARRPSS